MACQTRLAGTGSRLLYTLHQLGPAQRSQMILQPQPNVFHGNKWTRFTFKVRPENLGFLQTGHQPPINLGTSGPSSDPRPTCIPRLPLVAFLNQKKGGGGSLTVMSRPSSLAPVNRWSLPQFKHDKSRNGCSPCPTDCMI